MIGLILMSINAIRDSTAKDMVSAVIVQLMVASFFISGYIDISYLAKSVNSMIFIFSPFC